MPLQSQQNIYKPGITQGQVARHDPNEYRKTIDELGRDIIHYTAVVAPNQNNGGMAPYSEKNSNGLRYVWINPTELRGLITSLDVQNSYDRGGSFIAGMSSLSINGEYRLGFRDKIVAKDSIIPHSERLRQPFKDDAGNWKAYTTYPIVSVYVMFKAEGINEPYRKLEEGVDFNFSEHVISFSSEFDAVEKRDLEKISIRYEGRPVYYVDRVKHFNRKARTNTYTSENLTVNATIMLAHEIPDLESFEGNRFLDNSFDISCAAKPEKDKVLSTLMYRSPEDILANLTEGQKTDLLVLLN